MKIVKKIQLKIVIFTAVKNRCMFHGRVFVMTGTGNYRVIPASGLCQTAAVTIDNFYNAPNFEEVWEAYWFGPLHPSVCYTCICPQLRRSLGGILVWACLSY